MNELNSLEKARFNMVEQQIRPAEVLDPRVLDLIGSMSREDFAPEEYADLAYSDINIPIGFGQTMMKPIQEARFLQALDIKENDKILEIGTGSGYLTALLAQLGSHVHSVEIDQNLANLAQSNLQKYDMANITIEVGDAAEGWQKHAPYDVIVVTGSMPILSDTLKNQLNIGGRMIVTVGTSPVMTVLLVTRIDEDQWRQEALYETVLPQLKNVQQPQAFVF